MRPSSSDRPRRPPGKSAPHGEELLQGAGPGGGLRTRRKGGRRQDAGKGVRRPISEEGPPAPGLELLQTAAHRPVKLGGPGPPGGSRSNRKDRNPGGGSLPEGTVPPPSASNNGIVPASAASTLRRRCGPFRHQRRAGQCSLRRRLRAVQEHGEKGSQFERTGRKPCRLPSDGRVRSRGLVVPQLRTFNSSVGRTYRRTSGLGAMAVMQKEMACACAPGGPTERPAVLGANPATRRPH